LKYFKIIKPDIPEIQLWQNGRNVVAAINLIVLVVDVVYSPYDATTRVPRTHS